jgi:hypothetical protein
MLKDCQPSYQLPRPNDLEVKANLEVDKILEFIDNNISSFCPYYQTIRDSERENRISDFLVQHFQLCKNEKSNGFFPYDFRKNPTQEHSGKETDIGVFVMTRSPKPNTIIEFEAKRFSETSNNKEYVCGNRGGIERFKRGYHSSHLSICGMFGYIQSRTPNEWYKKVNDWIVELSKNNKDLTIDWSNISERLEVNNSFSKVEKYYSIHDRKQLNSAINIFHYFIDLN